MENIKKSALKVKSQGGDRGRFSVSPSQPTRKPGKASKYWLSGLVSP